MSFKDCGLGYVVEFKGITVSTYNQASRPFVMAVEVVGQESSAAAIAAACEGMACLKGLKVEKVEVVARFITW